MSDTKNTETLLQEFLAYDADQRAQGFTTANVLASMHELQRSVRLLGGRVAEHDVRLGEHDDRLDSHGAAIVIIKRRLRQDSNDDEMDTGQFDLAAIRKKVEEQEEKRRESERVKAEDQTWWKRSVIMWVVGALGVVVTTLLTVLVTLAIAGATAPKAMPPQPVAHP